MKTIITTFIFSFITSIALAQLNAGDNIYLRFENIDGEVNVNGEDACAMLKDYIDNKTSLIVVSNREDADFIFSLYVIEKNMGNRKGKLDIVNPLSGEKVFESKWRKGTMNAFYGYSGTRHAIGLVVKKDLLKKFRNIKK